MRMRELGYRGGMQASGLSPRVLELSASQESTRIALLKLLSGKLRPTALLCANNLLTRHVLHAMQTMNMHPPDPVALVGFDDFDTADLMRPGITTVRQLDEVLGRTAAQMLFERITAGARAIKLPPREVMMSVELVIRGSCGAKTSVI
jgi:LacI family transcriptional regulator